MADFDRESMLEMFIFEMTQLTEQLETTIVQSETEYNTEQVNEIFRIMHTIKGSAAMMLYDNIASVAHSVEDLFFYLREESPQNVDFPTLSDHVLAGLDFVKAELAKIQEGKPADGDGKHLIEDLAQFLKALKAQGKPAEVKAKTDEKPAPKPEAVSDTPSAAPSEGSHSYKALIRFEDGCEMENIRAYTLVHNLSDIGSDITHIPADVIDDEAIEYIRKNGFTLNFNSVYSYEQVHSHLSHTVYLRDLELEEIQAAAPAAEVKEEPAAAEPAPAPAVKPPAPVHEDISVKPAQDDGAQGKKAAVSAPQHMISVNVVKLDNLLNLMGELVIAEAMVTQNSDLEGLQLDSFMKEARQLHTIIDNLQQTILTMRMVPLSSTFFKMNRIVRDMCRQLGKEVQLEILGEDTEVDKNIIEHISDPIMHIIRNSVDHGIELPEERRRLGKPEKGTVVLEAKNAGGDILILVKDDGAGINTEKVMKKAKENGLLRKPEAEYTDKEIQQFIFLPGFSTNEQVTTFSGRGVGMDVVMSNLEFVHGTVIVDSVPGEGSTFTLKIQSTMAIIEGMSVLMGGAKYTIPINYIIKSFKANKEDLFTDPNGNEMITVRDEIYNIVRLYEFFNMDGAVTDILEGTLIQIESGEQAICLLVDDLIGQQPAVVKPMPKYFKRVRGLSGCTLLGNGDISLIIDPAGFFDN